MLSEKQKAHNDRTVSVFIFMRFKFVRKSYEKFKIPLSGNCGAKIYLMVQ